MSSMTDIVFLLLLFFMIASTMSSPNDLKINLPQTKRLLRPAHIVKVGIGGEGHYLLLTMAKTYRLNLKRLNLI